MLPEMDQTNKPKIPVRLNRCQANIHFTITSLFKVGEVPPVMSETLRKWTLSKEEELRLILEEIMPGARVNLDFNISAEGIG